LSNEFDTRSRCMVKQNEKRYVFKPG